MATIMHAQQLFFFAVLAATYALAAPQCHTRPITDTAEAASDRVLNIPNLGPLPTRSYAGHLPIVDSQVEGRPLKTYMYYFFTESQSSNPIADPLFLYLNGGPGSSSLSGTFIYNGPFSISKEGVFSANPHSWNRFANVLWIDQPIGTGFSYVQNNESAGYDNNEAAIATHLVTCLTRFFERHPCYAKSNFYVFGDSYAGKYIPWLASTILNTTTFNLQGIGLGNAWVHPPRQAASYSEYLISKRLISQKAAKKASKLYEEYLQLWLAQRWEEALDVDNNLLSFLSTASGIYNTFNIEFPDADPYDDYFNALSSFLSDSAVRTAIHAGEQEWQSGDIPYEALAADQEQSALFLFPHLLSRIPVLLYNGGNDVICNYIGTFNYVTRDLRWSGQKDFRKAAERYFRIASSPSLSFSATRSSTSHHRLAGTLKSGGNLTFAVVFGAGHRNGFDQGQTIQALLRWFTSCS